MDNLLISLLSSANIDIKGLTPGLKNFIYAQVVQDVLPIGDIIKQAQRNAGDRKILEDEFQRIKKTLPELIKTLPLEARMILQPIIYLINKE